MICQFLPDLRGGSGEADVGPRGVQVKGVAEFRERRARAGGGGPARRRGALGRGLGYSIAARADLFERLPTYLPLFPFFASTFYKKYLLRFDTDSTEFLL